MLEFWTDLVYSTRRSTMPNIVITLFSILGTMCNIVGTMSNLLGTMSNIVSTMPLVCAGRCTHNVPISARLRGNYNWQRSVQWPD